MHMNYQFTKATFCQGILLFFKHFLLWNHIIWYV